MLSQQGFMLEPLSEEEVDDFGYTHVEGAKASIAKDVVTLSSYEVLEKLAVSFGLAQSVKLGAHVMRRNPSRSLAFGPSVLPLAIAFTSSRLSCHDYVCCPGVFERTVEQTIQETRSIPERMAIDGKIRLQRTAITKRIGCGGQSSPTLPRVRKLHVARGWC